MYKRGKHATFPYCITS